MVISDKTACTEIGYDNLCIRLGTRKVRRLNQRRSKVASPSRNSRPGYAERTAEPFQIEIGVPN